MFRKLVSSLPFSPALVGQLGFYARRLGREQAARRLGLIFTVLAIVVQILVLVNPPEPTYASTPTNECAYSSGLTKNDPACRACPYNSNIWVNDPSCNKDLHLSVEAINLSRSGKPVGSDAINPSDRIQYTIHTVNNTTTKTSTALEISVGDILEYGTVTDTGSGAYDSAAQRLSWGSVILSAGQSDARSFVITMSNPFPVTPQAVDNPSSYDCVLSVLYGNALNSAVSCPVGKEVENAVKQLPETGTGTNITFSIIILLIVTYLYLRAKQMAREIKIIRRNFNVGQ